MRLSSVLHSAVRKSLYRRSRMGTNNNNNNNNSDILRLAHLTTVRQYTATSILWNDNDNDDDDDNTAQDEQGQKKELLEKKKMLQAAANTYNRNRAVYKQQVRQVRKQYASEVAKQRAAEEAAERELQARRARKALERTRIQNVRAARNAIKAAEVERQDKLRKAEEYRIAKEKRDARHRRFQRARQMIVDELEAECHLWLTTHDEVDRAFTPEVEQELWGVPNSVFGAPEPTDDAHYWALEAHPWRMDKTYPTRQELYWEEFQEMVHEKSNIDRDYWREERVAERRRLEDKAKLRAMVRDEGRKSLLKRQRELLEDEFLTKGAKHKGAIPMPMPVPDLQILSNQKAMEKEGTKILLEDPTKFFVFEGDEEGNEMTSEEEYDDGKEQDDTAHHTGRTRGVPVALKDLVRDGSAQHLPYPLTIGFELPKDRRTEREKKRDEKEQAMIAAAAAAEEDAEEEEEFAEAMDIRALQRYDPNDNIDFDTIRYQTDEEWEEGLDPIKDAKLLATPREYRFTEDEILWMSEKVQGRIKKLEDELEYATATLERDLSVGIGIQPDGEPDPTQQETEREPVIEVDGKLINVEDLGVDVAKAKEVFSTLNNQQVLKLHMLEADIDAASSSDAKREILSTIDGLTSEQIDAIVTIEETIAKNLE